MTRRLGEDTVSLTSLMDVLTILLFFLVSIVAEAPADAALGDGSLPLPISTTTLAPTPGVSVRVTREGVLVDGAPVLVLDPAASPTLAPEQRARLAEALTQARRGAASPETAELECDKALPFSLVQDVMKASTEAGFPKTQLLVRSTGSAGPE